MFCGCQREVKGFASRMEESFSSFLEFLGNGIGIMCSLYSTELQMDICFINIYGPYVDREGFWYNLLDFISINYTKIIFGGELNFSMGISEIWGDRARIDCLSDFFSKFLDDYGLVDIFPNVNFPRNNKRVGNEIISKRLDRLLISVDLLEYELCFRQWVGCGENLIIILYFYRFWVMIKNYILLSSLIHIGWSMRSWFCFKKMPGRCLM